MKNRQQETVDTMHAVIFTNTIEEAINNAPLSEILPALNTVALINNLNLSHVKDMKKAYRLLLYYIRNN